MTDIRVSQDEEAPEFWRVEETDQDGVVCAIALFAGQDAQGRAREYAHAELRARAYANWLQSGQQDVHPWLPMPLAPQDGEEIALLCWLDDDAGYIMRRGCWGAGMWWNLEAGEPVQLEVLAWVPMPRREDRERVKRGGPELGA